MLLWLGDLNNNDERWLKKVSNNRLMDGVIVVSLTHEHPLFSRLLKLPYPLVLIDQPLEHSETFNFVSIDNVAAAEALTTHLIQLGRRRIGHVMGDPNIADAHDRLQGYKNALIRAGLPIDPNLITEGRFNRQSGYEATRRLLAFHPDAIFAASDTVALGTLQAAHEAGLRVPHDLAVVGFDDVDVAAHAFPPLTTMVQPLREKGAAAAQLLIDLIQGRVQSPQAIGSTELIIRQSCGAQAI